MIRTLLFEPLAKRVAALVIVEVEARLEAQTVHVLEHVDAKLAAARAEGARAGEARSAQVEELSRELTAVRRRVAPPGWLGVVTSPAVRTVAAAALTTVLAALLGALGIAHAAGP